MASTSTLGSNNGIVLYQDLVLNRVGINNSAPSCALDVANIGNFRSNLYIQGSIVANGSNCFIQSQYPGQPPIQIFQSNNGVGNFINYASGNPGFQFLNGVTIVGSYLSNQGTFSSVGSAIFQNNISVQNNIIMSNTSGNGIIYCSSNNYIGINQSNAQYSLDIYGAINATTYCNLMINSSSNISISNAPTNYALSTKLIIWLHMEVILHTMLQII